jgi:hypothetical protein
LLIGYPAFVLPRHNFYNTRLYTVFAALEPAVGFAVDKLSRSICTVDLNKPTVAIHR